MTITTNTGTVLTGHAATAYYDSHCDELDMLEDGIYTHVANQPERPSDETDKFVGDTLEEVLEEEDLQVSQRAYDLGMTQAEFDKCHTPIPNELYNQLNYLGLIPSDERAYNVGGSDYSRQLLQPWSIMLAYKGSHNYLELDVVKRILRSKSADSRLLDLQKCKHILDELIRIEQLKEES